MESIDLIRDNLTKSRERVLARVEEMREHALVFPTPNGGCHTLWVLGHLAYIESLIVRTFLLGEENPLAGNEDTFGTGRRCLQFVADHTYMHRGHLSDARRAAGLDRIWV